MNRPHRLLPPAPRFFPAQRWFNIGLRCAHLVSIAGIGGGFLFDLPEAQWRPFWHLTLGTGGVLVLLYVWTDFAWLLQLKGQAVLLKLTLLALAHFYFPNWRDTAFIGVIVLSGFFAHAPDRLRSYAWGRAVRPGGSSRIEETLK